MTKNYNIPINNTYEQSQTQQKICINEICGMNYERGWHVFQTKETGKASIVDHKRWLCPKFQKLRKNTWRKLVLKI